MALPTHHPPEHFTDYIVPWLCLRYSACSLFVKTSVAWRRRRRAALHPVRTEPLPILASFGIFTASVHPLNKPSESELWPFREAPDRHLSLFYQHNISALARFCTMHLALLARPWPLVRRFQLQEKFTVVDFKLGHCNPQYKVKNKSILADFKLLD